MNAYSPVSVVDSEIISESFPEIYPLMEGLGANLRIEYKGTNNEV